MRIAPGFLPVALTSLLLSLSFATQPPRANAQTSPTANSNAAATANTAASSTEIPLQRCDRLPVVIVQVNGADKRFR
jgi:hypothetical protein